jgi:beta-lactamase regulating signal transducer with metallopeptidase domain
MPFIFEYLIKQSISLAIIYLFYRVVLRRLTFYIRNRWYLLGYSILSFLIPFINISPFLQKNEWTDNKLLNIIPLFENYTSANAGIDGQVVSAGWSRWDWLFVFLFLGICLMMVRLLIQLCSFQKMKRTGYLISENKIRVYQVNKSIIPFSFGNAIFINHQLHNDEDLEKVISHEFIHVRQKHSIDIMWGELLCILNWFNPFAWFIRSAIRQNLEFIADSKVVEEGIDKKQYQYLLLKVIGNNHFSIANQFNFSSLKKRIAMMNKMKTARVQLIKFLFVLPVTALLLLAFRERFADKTIDKSLAQFNQAAEQLSGGVNVVDQFPLGKKVTGVTDSIPEALRIKEEGLRELLKPYSLFKTDEMTSEQHAFFERNPKVNLLHWKKLFLVEVYLSNGTVEEYNLGTDGEKFEKKYGKLPPVGGSTQHIYSSPEVTTAVAASVSPITAISGNLSTTTIAVAPSVSTINAEFVPAISIDGSVTIASTAPVIRIDAMDEGEKIMELKIYKKTKKEELNKLVEEAKTKGVILEFDDPEYNGKGELVSLSGTMKKDDAKSTFSATDFEILRLIMFKQDDHYSLRVSVGKKEVI